MNNTKRILLIARCPAYPLHLGDRLIIYNLARELHARGHRIDLLAFTQHDSDFDEVEHYADLFGTIELMPEPVRTPRQLLARMLNGRKRFPKSAAESWSPAMWAAIEKRLANDDYDVVQLFGGVHVYEFRALVEHLPNLIVPYESYSLLLQRTMDEAATPEARWQARMQLQFAKRYESWMFSGYDKTVVVSALDAATLQALNTTYDISVIPNGVDLDRFQPSAERPDTHTLIFTGNFEYEPNQHAARRLLEDIFPAVQEVIPDAELLLVGNAPTQTMHDMATVGVTITGRVPELTPYLDSAAIYVCPLYIGAGIKNKVLEALAMQLAVVGTPVCFDGISVVDGRDAVVAESDEAIIQATIDLLQDPAKRADIAANGRSLIENIYTWSRVADQYEALYHT